MGLPFSHFLLFGTLCLLGTSLRLIGTRLSGKMLLHTFYVYKTGATRTDFKKITIKYIVFP